MVEIFLRKHKIDHPKLSKKPKTPSVAMLNHLTWGGEGGGGREKRQLTN